MFRVSQVLPSSKDLIATPTKTQLYQIAVSAD